MARRAPALTLFPYTTLFRSEVSSAFETSASAIRRAIGAFCVRTRSRSFEREASSVLTDPERIASAFASNAAAALASAGGRVRSEEHTSELQSHSDLVCRLLL